MSSHSPPRDQYHHAKSVIEPWRRSLYSRDSWELDLVQPRKTLEEIAESATFHMGAPFGSLDGAGHFVETVLVPLVNAVPDLERRDYIVIAGLDESGALWAGCAGYYTGTFLKPWLDIAPTGHQVVVRFHEFYRIEDDRVQEFQGLWDIPSVMMQAKAWPLAPSLGLEWHVPGPTTQDGLRVSADEAASLATRQHIVDMLEAMKRHPQQPPGAMEMERFWHQTMNWYGPAGIGTGRGVAGFRYWHQIPFLSAMPDRGQYVQDITYHFFAEGPYAAVTGWPNMIQTLTEDGWLGIAPSGKRITMRSLDFWRLENGKIRENWVLVDLLDMYSQIGVDVFARLREFNRARNLGPIEWSKDYD